MLLHWWVLVHTLAHGILHHKIWASERAAAATTNKNKRTEHLLPPTATTRERSIFYLPANYCQPPKKFYKHLIDNIIQHSQKIWLKSQQKLADLVPCNKGTKMEFRALRVFVEDVVRESLRNKTNEVAESKNKWKCHPPKTITRIDKCSTIIARVKLCYCICYEIYLPTSYFPWLVHKNPSCIETEIYTHTILYYIFGYWSIQHNRGQPWHCLLRPVDNDCYQNCICSVFQNHDKNNPRYSRTSSSAKKTHLKSDLRFRKWLT